MLDNTAVYHEGWRTFIRLFSVMGCVLMLPFKSLNAQSPEWVHGHIVHDDGGAPCGDALVQAWPCGAAFPVNSQGRFDAHCPEGIDSLSVIAHGHKVEAVAVQGRVHIDVRLTSLGVDLAHALVQGNAGIDAPEAVRVERVGDLMETLDRTAGMRSLDLGAGLIQPVLRGLMGTRVAVLEDGVPQAGGRWGADHGILVAPELYDGVEWVPGGGHIWLGPSAMGGGLRLSAIRMLSEPSERTRAGLGHRFGDGRHAVHVLHQQRAGDRQWHVGVSASRFGDRNVPQQEFQYIGRLFALPDARLPNTGGHALHAVAGGRWVSQAYGQISLDIRASQVLQGLFPGIVGIPDQSDLLGDGRPYDVALPQQRAQRWQVAGKWIKPGPLDRTLRLAISSNQRRESAPPHAHGFGPEPDSDLSLLLDELHAFAEGRWQGIHGAFGVQAEWLDGQTDGWEFLLPDHRRGRLSVMGEWFRGRSRFGARVDAVHAAQNGHVEPLYAADGSVVGDDVRATAFEQAMLGGSLSWHRPWASGKRVEGAWTATVYSRAPGQYALGAHGIHHGTFRFERGNPDLRPEHSAEMRGSLRSVIGPQPGRVQWSLQAFAALHSGFIHLTPTAQFAPIAHAGQIYAFEGRDAVRVGGEFNLQGDIGQSTLAVSGSLLGQWAMETGLGLPFTPPIEVRSEWTCPLSDRLTASVHHRALAAANLTARNEAPTPGASLWGAALTWRGAHTALTLEGDNLMNVAWLDHASAYRALGLVAQGRWASLRFTVDVNRGDVPDSPQQSQL